MKLVYLTTNLIYINLFFSLLATIINLVVLSRPQERDSGLFNIFLSVMMASVLISSLMRLRNYAVCAHTPQQTLLLQGGMLLLQGYLFLDGLRILRGKKKKSESES